MLQTPDVNCTARDCTLTGGAGAVQRRGQDAWSFNAMVLRRAEQTRKTHRNARASQECSQLIAEVVAVVMK